MTRGLETNPHRAPRARPAGALRRALVLLILGLALAPAFAGCAKRGVSIDSRPTPPQPPPSDTARVAPTPGSTVTPPGESRVSDSTVSSDERQKMMSRITADTTAAGAVIRRCASRRMLPDQEATFDSARDLLSRTRLALEAGEVWRAESLARRARQLAAALRCP